MVERETSVTRTAVEVRAGDCCTCTHDRGTRRVRSRRPSFTTSHPFEADPYDFVFQSGIGQW